MFGRITYTWDLMKASWDVLRQDKSLLLFPLLSGISCLFVLASFALPIWFTGFWRPPGKGSEVIHQVAYYGTLFLFYLCNYFVITFFNTAVIACAIERMQGGQASVSFGFNAAMQRLPLILGWAAISATVGLILRAIEDRSETVGEIVAGLVGMAWTVVSYLAVPVMVAERAGPITALKESATLLKKTWGTQLIGNFGFGLIFGLLAIPAFLLIVLAVAAFISMHSIALGAALVVLAVLYILTLSLVQPVLQAIFQAAVYLYARDGQPVRGFPVILLQNAMRAKPGRAARA
jgi:hypothetical protein